MTGQGERGGRAAVFGHQDARLVRDAAVLLPDDEPAVPGDGVVHQQDAVGVHVPDLGHVPEAHDRVADRRGVGRLAARIPDDDTERGRTSVGEDAHLAVEGQVDLDGFAGRVAVAGGRGRSHADLRNRWPDVDLVVAVGLRPVVIQIRVRVARLVLDRPTAEDEPVLDQVDAVVAVVGCPHCVLEREFGRGAVRLNVGGVFWPGEPHFHSGRSRHRHRLREGHGDLDRIVLHVFAVTAGIRGECDAFDLGDGGGGEVADPEYAGKRQEARFLRARNAFPAQGVADVSELRRRAHGRAHGITRCRAVVGRAGANVLKQLAFWNLHASLRSCGTPVWPGTVVEVGVVIRDL